MILNKMNSTICGLLLLFVGLAITSNPALAQETQMGTSTIEGTVVDASNDQPMPNVTVKISGMDQETQTDEEGKFSFQDLNPQDQRSGELTLEIDHEGYERLSETVNLQDSQNLKLELQPEYELE